MPFCRVIGCRKPAVAQAWNKRYCHEHRKAHEDTSLEDAVFMQTVGDCEGCGKQLSLARAKEGHIHCAPCASALVERRREEVKWIAFRRANTVEALKLWILTYMLS